MNGFIVAGDEQRKAARIQQLRRMTKVKNWMREVFNSRPEQNGVPSRFRELEEVANPLLDAQLFSSLPASLLAELNP